MVRLCRHCGDPLPPTSNYRRLIHESCLRARACIKSKRYRLAHPDKVKGWQQRWYQNNKEYVADKNASYHAANLEKITQQHKDYYRKNKDKWCGMRHGKPRKPMTAAQLDRKRQTNKRHRERNQEYYQKKDRENKLMAMAMRRLLAEQGLTVQEFMDSNNAPSTVS
jgi:hypothetical protein